jgi:uncharacterized protein YdhG (YjbR/CyaY superfamily)
MKSLLRRRDERGINMSANQSISSSIDEYISGFPSDVQVILQKIRATIKTAAPDAEETIKYHMPTFMLNGNLVYFAAFKKHIGFYPPVTGDKQLRKQLLVYEGPKGSLKFPLDKPIPYNLIRKIVLFRVKENMKRAQNRQKGK